MPDMRPPHLHPLQWLGQRDRDFAALRRATRTAIIMPALFALGDKVIGNRSWLRSRRSGLLRCCSWSTSAAPWRNGSRRRQRSP